MVVRRIDEVAKILRSKLNMLTVATIAFIEGLGFCQDDNETHIERYKVENGSARVAASTLSATCQ